jgi:hypothetical protein
MDLLTVSILIIDLLLFIPLVFVLITRSYYNVKFELSKSYARLLGFLISINGAIRSGKTSFQSGISHIFQLEIECLLTDNILNVKKVYKKLDFNKINDFLDEGFKNKNYPDFKNTHIKLLHLLESFDLEKSMVFTFISSKNSHDYFEDYIFAYWVLNYRKNYVQSKTKFYSHITGNFNYDYKIENQKIFVAFEQNDYSIYDYMVELIDELSDELGANKRFEDVKEEDGDKDYRRKFGQIHQERNRLVTTKQDSRDELKKFRTLTQSNLWIPNKVEVTGTFRLLMSLITILYSLKVIIYEIFTIYLVYYFKKILYMTNETTLSEYKERRYNAINLKRNIQNKLLFIDWFLKSVGYNKYEIWNYPSEEDVKKRDPMFYDQLFFYIPTLYCFGTYETHFYRMIQAELLAATNTNSAEINWFLNPKYFNNEVENGGDKDDIDF